VWDRFAGLFTNRRGKDIDREFSLEAQDGYLIDSRAVDLIEFAPGNRSQASIPPPLSAPASLKLSGVVYTALLNPWDESKNWKDLVWTFCWALKERADATLVIKLTCPDADDFIETLLYDVYRMTPVSCRIVVLSGFLTDSSYESLAANTTYAVSSSHAEGQSMPLMEFMSCGAPAITPCHTGLADYIDKTNAFIIESNIAPSYWAEDPRHCYRTMWHRLSWESMVDAFQTSYRVARDEPEVYEEMSRSACSTMKQHCSSEAVAAILGDFFSDMFNSFKQYSNSAGPVPGRSGK
jgi:glycosyltransferase involved in cell wall biosynthesis